MRTLALLLIVLMLASCAARQAHREGMQMIEAGRVDEGLAKIEEAAKLDPSDQRFRTDYFRQRELAVQRYLALAETARTANRFDDAENIYKRTLAIDPGNGRATTGLAAIALERKHALALSEANARLDKGDFAGAQARLKAVLSEAPAHREAQALLRRVEERIARPSIEPALITSVRAPVTLEFREASLRQVFELLSRRANINFLFDREVKSDLRTTLFVRNTAIEDVLRFVTVTNQLAYKILNDNTILVYPNTPAKQKDLQELVTRTFYISNADVKQTATMLRTMVKTKDVFVDEKLNIIVMRDTLDAVRMAERLVANQDLAEPEVMLEVEVIEIGSNALTELGLRFPSQVSFSLLGAAGTAGTLTLPEWQNRSSGLVRLTITDPAFVINLKSQAGATNLLANPRIRVKNREKAKVHIGDKVPVITTTTTATGFASESVSYLDVGLKLDVEPTISLQDEVGIKIGLEVSNIVQEIRSSSGTLTYRIGTRNAATTLRLHDGETQILAGLISDEDRRTADKVPGLGDLPIVGRIFSSAADTASKTEIVLLITPRIVHTLARPDPKMELFSSGTEAAIGMPVLRLEHANIEAPGVANAKATPSVASPPLQESAGSARISLETPNEVSGTQAFAVEVMLDASQGIRSATLVLAFDPKRLRVVKVEPGAFVRQGVDQFSSSVQAQAPVGKVSIAVTGHSEIRGKGALAVVTLEPVAGVQGVGIIQAALTDASGRPAIGVPPAVAQVNVR